MGALLVFQLWAEKVQCQAQDFARFVPAAGQTCDDYMAPFLSRNTGYLSNPVREEGDLLAT